MSKVIAVVALLVLVVVIGGIIVPNRRSGSALARYKAELRGKGEKLMFSEYVASPSTNPDDIASRQVFTTNELPDVEDNPILMDYVLPGKARVAWRGQPHLYPTNDGEPFSIGDWEKLEDQDGEVSEEMQKFVRALESPAPDSGWVYEDNYQNMLGAPELKLTVARGVARNLAKEALLNLHKERMEAAVSNLASMAALPQLYRNEPAVISELVRASNAKLGLLATWEALQATNWVETRLAALQHQWESVELFEGLERGYLYERTDSILTMEMIRNLKVSELTHMLDTPELNPDGSINHKNLNPGDFWKYKVGPVVYRISGLDGDERSQLAYWTGMIESVRLEKAGRPLFEAAKPGMAAKARAEREQAGASAVSRFLSLGLTPNLTNTLPMVAKIEAQRRLTITAIAIKRYQLKHGQPPPGLASLTPEFLATVPIDPMSGKALCYRLNADGSFVLYSVGEDGKDDGGDPTPSVAGAKPGLWEGRDAVWPSAATPDEAAAADAAASNPTAQPHTESK